jgi:hypothetical protein
VVPQVVRHDPLAVEGLDDTLISLERDEHLASDALDALPEGSGWLMVQFGDSKQEVAPAQAHACGRDGPRPAHPRRLMRSRTVVPASPVRISTRSQTWLTSHSP